MLLILKLKFRQTVLPRAQWHPCWFQILLLRLLHLWDLHFRTGSKRMYHSVYVRTAQFPSPHSPTPHYIWAKSVGFPPPSEQLCTLTSVLFFETNVFFSPSSMKLGMPVSVLFFSLFCQTVCCSCCLPVNSVCMCVWIGSETAFICCK